MKILFITYNFFPDFDANSSIIYNLTQSFIDKGHEVHVLPLKHYSNLDEKEVWNNVNIHRVTKSFDKKQVTKYFRNINIYSALKLSLSIFKDKLSKKEYLWNYWSYFPSKTLKGIISEHDIDIVINVCYPFESSLAVMKYLQTNARRFQWIIYMQDPFSTQYYYLKKYPKRSLVDFQSKIFHKADKIIVTDKIKEELIALGDEGFINKSKVLKFPIIKKVHTINSSKRIIYDENYVNCLYVGKFNNDTRNPENLFKIFESLREKNIRLHVIGEEKKNWEQFLSDKESNIFFYGFKPKDFCVNSEIEANVLVNLGNTVNNQLPSKLLEYISKGKPIFNLYKIKDCPTLEYAKKYPVCLNSFEDKNNIKDTVKDLYMFCNLYQDKNIDYELIKERFYDSTVDYVSGEFLEICEQLSSGEGKLY